MGSALPQTWVLDGMNGGGGKARHGGIVRGNRSLEFVTEGSILPWLLPVLPSLHLLVLCPATTYSPMMMD